METNVNSPFPRMWKELQWIMANMKTCRESRDDKGIVKWSKKLDKWKNAHPKEAIAVVRVLTECLTECLTEGDI